MKNYGKLHIYDSQILLAEGHALRVYLGGWGSDVNFVFQGNIILDLRSSGMENFNRKCILCL